MSSYDVGFRLGGRGRDNGVERLGTKRTIDGSTTIFTAR